MLNNRPDAKNSSSSNAAFDKHFTRSATNSKQTDKSQLPKQLLSNESVTNHDLHHLTNPKYIRWLHEVDNFRELMNCLCGLKEKTGVIVQCECCLTWQHVACLGVTSEKELPEFYVCYKCKNPPKLRESFRYIYDYSWLKNGTLPSLNGCGEEEDDMSNIKAVRRNKILLVNLLLDVALEVRNVIHALNYKIGLLKKKDPDLSLWKESWLSKDVHTPPLTAQQEKSQQELSVYCNDFVPLKSTGIHDILDFSKDILETAPMEEDKDNVPDDLQGDLQETTDLIEFIASSYDDSNHDEILKANQQSDLPAEVVKSNQDIKVDENTAEADSTSRTNSQTSFLGGPKEFDCDESNLVQNLREHLVDLQNRLLQRLDFLTRIISDLELDYGLYSDTKHLDQDAEAFKDLIKELYKDLDLVQRINLCAPQNKF